MTLAVAIAIAASLLLTPVAKRLAWRFNAVSRPDGQRKMQALPTPMWGGGSVYLALLLSATVAWVLVGGINEGSPLPATLALTAGILCVLGCYDDLFEMSARWKLFWQIIATLPIVLAGGGVERLIVLGYPIELGLAGMVFTVAWLVLGINALNLLDGMDGLASIVGIGTALCIAMIAVFQDDPAILRLSLVLAGALIGFLAYNLPPARIYLGDCGSMIIGVTLALLVLRVSQVDRGTSNFTVAATLLFVPLADTTLAIVRRVLRGTGFMAADREHVHHRLLDQGFNVWQVLGVLGGLCLATGMVAWMVAMSALELRSWCLLGAMVVLLVKRGWVGHVEWTLMRQFSGKMVDRVLRRPTATEEPGRLQPGMSSAAEAQDKDELGPLPVLPQFGTNEDYSKVAA